jgi:exosortase
MVSPLTPHMRIPAPLSIQLASLLLFWFLAVRQVLPEWTGNEQYQYGGFVPFFVLYALKLRWHNRPAREAGMRPASALPAWFALAAIASLVLPLCEVDPQWRILGWLLAGSAVAATLLVFHQWGGRAWLRHFAPPVLLFLAAVPWPQRLENQVMLELMGGNASLTAALLRVAGIAATAEGNVIWLAGENVSVDEACSGVRSLQACMTMALFAGEILGLHALRRLLLLGAGVVGALVANLLRTALLAFCAHEGGPGLLESWHDGAGHFFMFVSLLGVIVLGWLMQASQPAAGHAPMPAGKTVSASPPRGAGAWLAASLIMLALTVNEAWFRLHEPGIQKLAGWRFRMPEHSAGFESIGQNAAAQRLLYYDAHRGARWRDAAGRRWVGHFFEWFPAEHGRRVYVNFHDPRVCESGSGKELVATLEPVIHPMGDMALPFDAFWFRDRGENVFIFNCVETLSREEGHRHQAGMLDLSRRLRAIRHGVRRIGHLRLEIAVWGAADAAEARLALSDLLSRQLVMAGTDSPSERSN